jgi:hypothetical protein
MAAAPAQADPQLFIGLQEAGVNGGAITMEPTAPPTAYGTFFESNNAGLANPAAIAPTPTLPLLQADTIDVSIIPGTLVVWMTVSGNLGANLPLGTQEFESSFRQNLLPTGWTVQVDTFLDPANGVFTTAIPLSSHLFHASDYLKRLERGGSATQVEAGASSHAWTPGILRGNRRREDH